MRDPQTEQYRRPYANDAPGFMEQHRASVVPQVGRWTLVQALLLAVGATAGWLFAYPWVAAGWGYLLHYSLGILDLPGQVVMVLHSWGGFTMPVPFVEVPAGLPSTTLLLVTGFVTLLFFAASFYVPERMTPLIYFMRALAFIQTTALVFFTLWPRHFAYTLPEYGAGMMWVSAVLLALVPLVLGLTFYIQDLYFYQKAGLTFIVLLYLSVLIPVQYLFHAVAIHYGSLLFMPLLYLIFGLPMDVLAFVALYAWGMSWKGRLVHATTPVITYPYEQDAPRRLVRAA